MKPDRMKIVCAFSEGPGIGLGHRRRVEGLARQLAALGFSVDARVLDAETDDGAVAGDGAVTGEIVLVDSYLVRADDRARVRGDLVVAIDDLQRDLAVDLVVDPDPGADARVHAAAGAVVAGAPYALVDARLRDLVPAPVGAEVDRVLVTTGGTDSEGIGARIAVDLAGALPSVRVRHVVGPWGRGADDARVESVDAPDGLGPEIAASDIVVTAGGVSMLEACCLGRPVVAFSIAVGQDRSLHGAAQVGAVRAADVDSAAQVTRALAHDRADRQRLSEAAQILIDGQGSARVAAIIAGMARQGVHAR
jgi:spore coat polysaccharide biosynthesis predicted glycosyltransferase SpsG